MSNHRTVMDIVRVGCKRIRTLVDDPRCWDAKEIKFVADRMEQQVKEEIGRQFAEEPDREVR